MTVTRSALVVLMLAVAVIPQRAPAGQGPQHDARSCLVEVLHSEELPLGPLFYHTVKARLLVTPADRPPFETTVARAIPWQAPPPRQHVWVACESVSAQSDFHLF